MVPNKEQDQKVRGWSCIIIINNKKIISNNNNDKTTVHNNNLQHIFIRGKLIITHKKGGILI